MMDFPPVVLEREYAATTERVFEAWTDPALLKNWFRSSEQATVEEVDLDLRVGGGFRIGVRYPSDYAVVHGTYINIEKPNLLEFTWKWDASELEPAETLVRVEIEPTEEGSRLRVTHSRFSTEKSAEGHGAGWNGVLSSLSRLLDS